MYLFGIDIQSWGWIRSIWMVWYDLQLEDHYIIKGHYLCFCVVLFLVIATLQGHNIPVSGATMTTSSVHNICLEAHNNSIMVLLRLL
jgi:hypothetical protein